jgi:hypothetical protein
LIVKALARSRKWEPRDLLERRVAALDQRAQQRRSVAGALAAELNDVPAHGVYLFNDAEALKARAKHAGISPGE